MYSYIVLTLLNNEIILAYSTNSNIPNLHALKTITLILALICVPLKIFALDPPLRATSEQVSEKLKELDKVLSKRATYLADRERKLDSLSSTIGPTPADTVATYLSLGESMSSYSVEGAIKYLTKGLALAEANQMDKHAAEYRLTLAGIYPANGYIAESLKTFNEVDFEKLPKHLHAKYYCSGEKMYEGILDYYTNTDVDTEAYSAECAKFRQNAMYYFPPESSEWLLREAKQYISGISIRAAQISLYDLINSLDDTDPIYTEATRLMAKCTLTPELEHDHMYYLAASAISEIKHGNRDGAALHLTGQALFDYGDIDRAHSYLSKAIESIPEPGAQSLRNEALIKTLMTIEKSYDAKMNNNIRLLSILIVMLVLWVIFISLSLRRNKRTIRQLSYERHLVIEANNAKETFLRNFLKLGIVSSRRLTTFCRLVTRKIASKQFSDIYETSKSGKIIDEQRKQFMTIFDASLLSIYPSFITEVNALLRPEEQYNLQDNHVPSELRVLALTRLGIDDVSQIAEAMGFTTSTVYAYRTKVRNKAINKETFDSDIMNIGTLSPFSNPK